MRKRSITIKGHRTSVSLEQPFWQALGEVADTREISLSGLIAEIDAARDTENLSSAIRLFILDYYRSGSS